MQALHRLINYFARLVPLIVMSLLTLLSFVVVKHAVVPIQGNSPNLTPQSDHDYYLRTFSVLQYDPSGKLKSSFTGNMALHFEFSQFMDIQKFTFYSIGEDFQYTGTSDTARITDDGNDAKLYRQAKIDRAAPKLSSLVTTFESDFFHFTQFPDTLSSNFPVRIQHDRDKMTTNSLQYDSDERKLLLAGRVKINITPKKN